MAKGFDPLSSSFMVISMMGFIMTAVYTNSGKLAVSWGFSFLMIFSIMFIASVISMTKAPVEAELQIDQRRKKKEKK